MEPALDVSPNVLLKDSMLGSPPGRARSERWNVIAVARGVALSLATLVVELALVGLMRTGFGIAVVLLVRSAVLVNTGVAIAELGLALFIKSRDPLQTRHMPSHRRPRLFNGTLRIGATALPWLVFLACETSALPDRIFLRIHRQALERVVRDGVTHEGVCIEVWREGARTIVRTGTWGFDSHWFLHDPRVLPGDGRRWDDVSFLRARVDRIDHLEGPWYVMVD